MLTMEKIDHIDILDVTLRDGLQHEEIFVPQRPNCTSRTSLLAQDLNISRSEVLVM